MNLKEKIIKYLKDNGIKEYKLIYKKESIYQKRFKPEYREEEVWLYPKAGTKEYKINFEGETMKGRTFGQLITESDFKNKDYMEMTADDFKRKK